ncbi:hypothetical protein ASF57_24115 [Methylobacterium sp. Leaf117]|nr:hypothetical protein ASF57_24115 [Methylobacterium sp. Leaf117]
MPVLVRYQNRKGLVFSVLLDLVSCDRRQNRLRVTSRFFVTRKVCSLLIAVGMTVMDIEEITRHRALRAFRAGAHRVSQARKARIQGRDSLLLDDTTTLRFNLCRVDIILEASVW